MLYFSKLKLVIIYFIIIFLSLFSFLNVIEVKENFFLSKKVKLGLDLQGGSYLLLEVDSQPIVDRNLQEKLLKLRKYFKANKIKYRNLKLKNETINFRLLKNDIEKFDDFFLIRPQQKKVKEHKLMVAALKRGDEVVTSGGIVGKIERVLGDDKVDILISENVTVQVVQSTIQSLLSKPDTKK